MIAIIGWRLAAAAALLVVLTVLQLTLGAAFALLVSVGLVVIPALSWMTFWFFAKRAVLPDAPFTLKVRAQDAFALALASTVAGLLGVLAVLRAVNAIPPVPGIFLVGLSFALLMTAAPAVNWLLIWRPWED